MNSYDINAFTQDAEALFVDERTPRQQAELAAELLRKLAQGALYLDERLMRTTRGQPERTPYYSDPKGRYHLVTVSWPAGYSGPIHEHGTWGAMVGYRGRIIVTGYRRVDDGETEGHAVLNEMTRQMVAEGLVSFIRPPEDAIHRVENPYRGPALSVNIYGSDAPWTHVYDLEAQRVEEAGQPDQLD